MMRLAAAIGLVLATTAQANAQNLTGEWRGAFTLQDTLEVPFNFEIDNSNKVYFVNGSERFESGTAKIKGDSLYIPLDQFDNELALARKGKKFSGLFRRQNLTGNALPVQVQKGSLPRFANKKQIPPTANITGKYAVEFRSAAGKESETVGVFNQTGNRLTGTFLRMTGDSRYLQGIVSGNRFYLSAFFGSSPSYFQGTIQKDGSIAGIQAGTQTNSAFTGTKNDSAALPDAFSLTALKPGFTTFHFSFPALDGRPVSLSDEKYQGKVVILAITGTWCPNCVDEASFLAPWYQKNKDRGVEIIALHYERQSDTAYTHKVMRRFRNRFNIEYDQVFAGVPNSDSVKASLPELNTFVSFPTTIFIGKQGNVDKIHTGYSGPATGKYYDEFVREFNEEVDKLLKQ